MTTTRNTPAESAESADAAAGRGAAVREFRLPDLGEGLTGAEITRWLVDVGDRVEIDQPVVEVETAKAQVEVPCPYAGTVTERFGATGAEVPVGSPLIRVAADAEPGRDPVLVGYGPRPPAPSPTAADQVAPAREEPGGGPLAGEGRERPVAVASPLLRRLARDRGIDLRRVTGSGPGGLIVRGDLEKAAEEAAEKAAGNAAEQAAEKASPKAAERAAEQAAGGGAERAAAGDPAGAAGAPAAGVRTPLRGVHAAMAERVALAQRVPAATCWLDADATELLAAKRRTELPLLALLARICVAALARHPGLNATFDPEGPAVVRHPSVHLGIAVQTDRGLLVPVVHDAHTLGTGALAAELARVTEQARAGTLPPAALGGSTFTLNNYGPLGVDGSTPLLNHPEAAMLGVGRIVRKPWEHRGRLALRHVVQLSLTFDHRVCDGGTAAGCLREAAALVEEPLLLLREV
ncbi:dihydrolipoamide acetyltransferase family protein [Streptomyces marincola]|uniref:dihydrolipoamide acetyltransferase family protein n=1 Tax=Streptomyces marincola TaxID=2878388 RepID=UPI001CF4F90C|nr:dihydrolipoamide acetyltransferase family protein [Streptomyces marincola]UCM89038.1 2-oxo acid dehydrogenase subunit E2 [Streptomyces marincola]